MTWSTLAREAPTIAAIFQRRHHATGNLCLLATNRPDGYPRISPMEPRFLDDDLMLIGMPHTTKFADLACDSRFSLHTATVDSHVGDGDAKIWGRVEHIADKDRQQRFADTLFIDTGIDVRGQTFDQFLRADIEGAAAVELHDGQLAITTWRRGHPERRHTR